VSVIFAVFGCLGGIAGAILLFLAVYSVDNLPASVLCEAAGYNETDCSSTDQPLFTVPLIPPICLKYPTSPDCYQLPPPCCVGKPDTDNSWAIPPGDNSLLPLNQVACDQLATSMRAAAKKCGRRPPCNGTIGDAGENITDAALDDYYDLSLEFCVKARMEVAYFFLYMTGPMVVIPVIILAYAHCRQSKGVGTIGIFLGTVAIAVIVQGVNCMLDLRNTLGWQVATTCNDRDQTYVTGGKYLGELYCIDQKINGDVGMNPNYVRLSSSMLLYFTGAVLCFVCLLLYIVLLFTACGRIQPDKDNHI